MVISKEQLLEFNQAGLIPGPHESEDDFLERAAYALNLKNQIQEILSHKFSLTDDDNSGTEAILRKGCEKAKELYDIFPAWVPLFFSNYKLPFWQGGCAWIFQQKQDSPTSAFFQLRQSFLTSNKYLGLYDRTELIAHELSHVGRMMFEEPKFEEILAYRSSESKFRRFLGPILQSSWESTIFVLVLMLLVAVDFFSLISQVQGISYLSHMLRIFILCMIGYGLLRIWVRQKQYQACLTNLTKILFDRHKAEAVAYRLTDEEIVSLGKMTSDQLIHFVKAQKSENLRWKFIQTAYFKPNLLPMNGSDSNSFPLETRKNKGAIFSNMAPLFSKQVRASREKITSNLTAFIGSKSGFN